jgi:hypothetical protein
MSYKWHSRSNELNLTFTLVSSYTPVMAERPKEYDVNSYGVYELTLLYRLHRLFFLTSTQRVYVINNNVFSLQIDGQDCLCSDKDDLNISQANANDW